MAEQNAVPNDIAMLLGALNANVQALRDGQASRDAHLHRIEVRLDKVEKFHVKLITAATMVVPVVSVVANYVVNNLLKLIGG